MTEIIVPDYEAIHFDGLALNTPSQANRSAWTGRRKVLALPGAERWRGQVSIQDIATESEERDWRSFLAKLIGPQNWFKWLLPCHQHIGPKPVVAAGAAAGNSLVLEGIEPNARILHAGQYMTVPLPSGHYRAVVLVDDLRADATGVATASFYPALNEIPTAGAEVETTDPFVPMSPTTGVLGLSLNEGVSGTSFEVEEAL